ncbi:MAG: hypothetical protein AMS16_05440, partial [Planctomycetes bacterium DG_58]
EGHLRIFAMVRVGTRCWVVSQSGLYVHDPQTDRFVSVVRAKDRLYFRATAAVAGTDAVWFGGDGGTVSRLDRKTGRLELMGVIPGRKVSAVALDKNGRVLVATGYTRVALPFSMRSVLRLPAADALAFDGKAWLTVRDEVRPAPMPFRCGYQGDNMNRVKHQLNYLVRDGKRLSFLQGVFRPKVLCEDPVDGKLWLATWAGAVSIPLPRPAADAPEAR